MNKKYIVRLTPEDRLHLEALVTKGTTAARKIQKAWILLKADAAPDGPAWSDEQIQQAYGVGLRTIHRVRQTWVEEGIHAVLTPTKRSRHRARKLDGDQEAHLIALACTSPPKGRRRWTIRLLTERFVELGYCDKVCPETVRQMLKKTN